MSSQYPIGKTIIELKMTTTNGLPFGSGANVVLTNPWTIQTLLVPQNHVATICDGGDDYRFGFNGQEKVNEIAGIGNHNTALYWEYGTREGRRWNRDPVVNPSVSPYAVFDGNPILKNDPLGNCTECPLKTSNGMRYAQPDKSKVAELEDVVVSPQNLAKGEQTEINATGGLIGGNGGLNIWQAANQDIGRNEVGRRKVEWTNQMIMGQFTLGAAVMAGATGVFSVGLTATSVGSGIGNLVGQVSTNEGSFRDRMYDVNWVGVGTATLFKNPLGDELVANSFNYSLSQGFQFTASESGFMTNVAVGTLLGKYADVGLGQMGIETISTIGRRSVPLIQVGVSTVTNSITETTENILSKQINGNK